MSRIRRLYLNNDNDLPIFSFGLKTSFLTFPVQNLGNSINSLMRFVTGKMPAINTLFSGRLYNDFFFLFDRINFYTKPMIFVGTSVLYRPDNQAIIAILFNYIKKQFSLHPWKCFNLICSHLGTLSALELGLSASIKFGSKNFLYLCGTDKFDWSHKLNHNDFIVYQGPFISSNISQKMNLQLPSAAYTEQETTYINMEGRYRFGSQAITPFKHIKSDLDIVKALFICLRSRVNNNFSIIPNFHNNRVFTKINYNMFFDNICKFTAFVNKNKNQREGEYYVNLFANLNFKTNKIYNTMLSSFIHNYYNTDPLVKNSKIMGLCALKFKISNY